MSRVAVFVDAGNSSQAPLLKQVADTTSVWNRTHIEKFLSVREVKQEAPVAHDSQEANLDEVASKLADSLDDDQVRMFAGYRKTNTGVPSELDGKLLARARDAIGRDLNTSERKSIRAKFVESVKVRQPELFS